MKVSQKGIKGIYRALGLRYRGIWRFPRLREARTKDCSTWGLIWVPLLWDRTHVYIAVMCTNPHFMLILLRLGLKSFRPPRV